MSVKNRKLGRGVQALEQRAMMAGDVAVAVVDGDLFISEGSGSDDIGAAQQVQVMQLKGGMVRVQGLGKTDIDSLTIDGRSIPLRAGTGYVDVPVSDDIYVDLRGGDDDVYFAGNNGGVQADRVEIFTGAGDDYVSITGMDTRDNLEIFTDQNRGSNVNYSGDDDVIVSSATIGDQGWEDLKVRTGAGADNVRVLSSVVQDNIDVDLYFQAWEADADELYIDGVTAKDVLADFGNGADDFSLKFSNIQYTVDANLGYNGGGLNDNDYAHLGFNNVGLLIDIDGRDGNDEVSAAYNTVERFRFDGGIGGDDRLYLWTANGVNSNDVDQYEVINAAFATYGY